MKMVSQLTRQAMSRHRLLSAMPQPELQPVSPVISFRTEEALSADCTPVPSEPVIPASSPLPEPPRTAAQPFPLRTPPQQTIYGQLMKKHDRFTERHLSRT